MIKYPDYDNSILSVISSILKYYGYDNGHKSLEILDKKLEKRYKNIVLMIFDGMGVSALNKHLRDTDFLMQHYEGAISSVCPSTTGCAIPTIESGKSPIEHYCF
jgi:predicted AlkP superfamily pyrophosphatase or phosphodiesterase